MKNSNIVKLDSKGRILIPIHIRKFLNVANDTDIVIIPDSEKNEARILPLLKDKTAELKFLLTDLPGSLASVANILANNNIDIIMSESIITKKGLSEWKVIVDMSECDGNFSSIKEKLSDLDTVKAMEIVKK